MNSWKNIFMSVCFLAFFVESAVGFDNNANFKNPENRREGQRDYTRENSLLPAGQGGHLGGHDTITAEAVELKKEVHKGNKAFEDFADQALPNFRAGAHDEDTNKSWNFILNDPPIEETGWGDYNNHFYNPETKKGLKWIRGANPATDRVKDYIKEIQRIQNCLPWGQLSNDERKRINYLFGRIMHLIQDMGNPSHTKDDIHVFNKPFEDYVRNNWDKIVGSDSFQSKVNANEYEKGQYENIGDINRPEKIIESLAEKSRKYSSEGELYDSVVNQETGEANWVLNEERLKKNADDLVPQAVLYSAGYIDGIYKGTISGQSGSLLEKRIMLASLESGFYGLARLIVGSSGRALGDFCVAPLPDPPNPAGDHPDDRFDVSDEYYYEKEFQLGHGELTDLFLRTAIKKGKIGVWYSKRLMNMFFEGRGKYRDASEEIKRAIEEEFANIKEKLAQRENEADREWKGAPDIALFTNGFYNPSTSLMLKIGEPVRFLDFEFNPDIVKDHPVMLVPTGGFYGMKNSDSIRAVLDEYVKRGGTLVVLTQQHGYDWAMLPTPTNEAGERKPIVGYGYQEDQSCQFNSVYIDTYHPMLSGFSKSTANIGVDGYFTSYPENATVLLRRAANGQPAMIIYPYGEGHVIATTLYTDFALAHHQANDEEIKLIQNIISWAKKPDTLVEKKPGETGDVEVSVSNFTDENASAIKFIILDPIRKVVGEEIRSISLPAGQSITIPVPFSSTLASALGIYHIDYVLLDGQGTIIQPQAETDSGRFVISNPAQDSPYKSPDFNFSIQSDAEHYLYGAPAKFTVFGWNTTDREAKITFRYQLPHLGPGGSWGYGTKEFIIPAKGQSSFDVVVPEIVFQGWLFGTFHDESGRQVGGAQKGVWMVYPSASSSVQTEKPMYGKGETVNIKSIIKNSVNADLPVDLRIVVTDFRNQKVFEDLKTISLTAFEAKNVNSIFPLPESLLVGSYTVRTELWFGNRFLGSGYTRFELPVSQISVVAALPSTFQGGRNDLGFTLTNTGKIPVNAGVVEVSLKDPDGTVVDSARQPFSLAVGESKGMNIPFNIPALRFGGYTLTYQQDDETRSGSPATVIIANQAAIDLGFDRTTYRVRDKAKLRVGLTNTGRFQQEGMGIAVFSPSLGYAENKALSLAPGERGSLEFEISIPTNISSGGQGVGVALAFPSGGAKERNINLMVPAAGVQLGMSAVAYKIGDTVMIRAENPGGLDSEGSAKIRLYDSRRALMLEKSESYSVPAGGISGLSFVLPGDLLKGEYSVVAEVQDSRTSQKFNLQTGLDIDGVIASLAVDTDKETYFPSENKTAFATIELPGSFPVQGNLNLRAIMLRPWYSRIPDEGEAPIDPNVSRNRWDFDSGEEISNGYIDLVVDAYGQFTIGTTGGDPENPKDDEAKLLYGHPAPGTSFATVRVDGMDYVFDEYYPLQSPYFAEGSIFAEQRVGGVRVIQKQSIAYSETGSPDIVKIEYLLRNEDAVAHSVGLRLMLDIQLEENDGAPFQIPGMGNVTAESEFLGDKIPPIWLSMNDLAYPTVISKGILVGRGATKPDRFVLAGWRGISGTDWDYAVIPDRSVTGDSAVGIWWNPQAIEAGQERRIITYYGVGSTQVSQVVWEANIPYPLSASGQPFVEMTIPQEIRGKFMLAGKLFSSSQQLIAESTDSFHIIPPEMALLFQTDKRFYRPGETVQIAGEVRNQTTVAAENLTLEIREETMDGLSRTLYRDTFSLSGGEKYLFGFSKTVGGEGTAILVGEVRQNDSQWVEIMDQYVVALPRLSAGITVPDSVGQEAFSIKVEVKNEGKVRAKTQLEITDDRGGKIEAKELTLAAGETRFLQYSQQVAKNTGYDFRFTGDLEKSEWKTAYFDLGGYVDFYPLAFYPDGKVGLPIVVGNPTGFAGTFEVHFQLNPGFPEGVKTYYLSPNTIIGDILYFDLGAGDYQITATSPVPIYSDAKDFKVRKENRVELGLALGAQAGGDLPIHVSLRNLGYNELKGSVSVRVGGSGSEQNKIIWNAIQVIDSLLPEGAQTVSFHIDPSAFEAGSYIITGELLDPAGGALASDSSPFSVIGPLFQVTEFPPFKTYLPGEEASFSFKVKNAGNQEGEFEFNLRSMDRMDLSRKEWLKAGEEKELSSAFPLPIDLEEKDYFASWRLQSTVDGPQSTVKEGQVKYHLAGINLAVNATLNKANYKEGETAQLNLGVSSPQTTPLSLFSRVNYAGFEAKEPFILNGQATLPFSIPLSKITGEKLFFGIYHESGRSIHLNSLYIHQEAEAITVRTDKQVYKPGETVSVSVSGTKEGTLTLSGPGGYSETFPFAGSAARAFILPSSMTAGTYYVSYQLLPDGGQNYTGSHPFDVDGIQVKVKEAILDKAKYASSDTIKLSLTIESNQDLPATLKTWVVDPEKKYTLAGTWDVSLAKAEPLLANQSIPFQTSKLGLHRLVYGLYSGEMLLCSGAEVFDMGEAVILGLITDKADYPTGQEPVMVTANLMGTVPANLELILDGQPVLSRPVSLSGFSTAPLAIPGVAPGPHKLRAVLTSGGLSSAKEASFLYGTNLPDLTTWIYSDPKVVDGKMKLTILVKNQGKSPSAPTKLYLYDGLDPKELLAILDVGVLAPGASQTFTPLYDCMGKTGGHMLLASIDAAAGGEFNSTNNEARISVAVPALALATAVNPEIASPGSTVMIRASIVNLSKEPSGDLTLKTRVEDGQGSLVFTGSKFLSSIAPMTTVPIEIPWPTDPGLPQGTYAVKQSIEGKDAAGSATVVLKAGQEFNLAADGTRKKVELGEGASFNLTLTPLPGFVGEVELSILDCPSVFAAILEPGKVNLSAGPAGAVLKVIPTTQVQPETYGLKVKARAGAVSRELSLAVEVTDFTVSISPESGRVRKLDPALFTIRLGAVNGFEGPVDLRLDGIPKGMKGSLSQDQITLPAEVNLSLLTSKWLALGEYEVNLVARGRAVTHRIPISLIVDPNPLLSPKIVTVPEAAWGTKKKARVFDAQGRLLSELPVPSVLENIRVALGDVDGDGLDEMIAGTDGGGLWTHPRLEILRRDGTVLHHFELTGHSLGGVTVAVGDLDGDWVEEIAVGSYIPEWMGWIDGKEESLGRGVVKIYRLMEGRLIDTGLTLYPYETEGYQGIPHMAFGDVDGDGVPELITAPGLDPYAPAHVKVFKIEPSGGVGSWKVKELLADLLVHFQEAEDVPAWLRKIWDDWKLPHGSGATVSAADLDGDGKAEIILGAGPSLPTANQVVILYPADSYRAEFFVAYPGLGAGVNVNVGDLDEDGIAEIITGLGSDLTHEPKVKVFRKDGTLIRQFLAYPRNAHHGVRVSIGGISK